jgi:hypothetical protein
VRLGDADREAFYELLARHAADGRLDVDELERRVERIATAVTQEEAASVMVDLPVLHQPAGPPRDRGRRRQGHGDSGEPARDWTATPERFRDPGSDQIMRVWIDASGGRHYVADS